MPKVLVDQIKAFLLRSDIPTTLSGAVDGVRHFGNFGAHPLTDKTTNEVIEVEAGEAEWLLDILEALFDVAFLQPARLAKQKAELNKKLVAAGKQPMK